MELKKTAQLDVFGIGNALVDTLAFVENSFMDTVGVTKGVMTLADGDAQSKLMAHLTDHSLELRSGGSAANSMWAIARSGGKVAYTGVVSDDPNGEFYKHDLEQNGVEFEVAPLPETNGPTGTCIVMTTPDAERTMSTHLGVSVMMEKEFIDESRLKESKVLYIEGYLWDAEKSKQSCVHAMDIARSNGVWISFSFSDPFCVGRFKDEFHMLAKDKCDIVFCNADEARAFSGIGDVAKAALVIGELAPLVFVTDGDRGCLVVDHGEMKQVGGFPVKAIDTNGAGDAFAGGVLHALCQGESAEKSAHWGNYLASQIVSIHGARLQNDYDSHYPEIMGLKSNANNQ